jgi:hypothetical protein
MKKALTLLLGFLLTLSLCACSQTKAKGNENVITTKYYTVTLPEDWKGKCITEIREKEDGTYILNLYEKASYEEMGAGKLCSLMLFSTNDQTYEDLPDYKRLATLNTPEGSYDAVVLFPTDVQFQESTLESYTALYEHITEVLQSMRPVDGISLSGQSEQEKK